MESSAGWRPLTSQARGAKQPLPEPFFHAPPVSQEDLALLRMLAPKAPTEPIKPRQSEIAQVQASAVLVLNEKSHVVHAARVTNPESSMTKNTKFEINCGASVLDPLPNW